MIDGLIESACTRVSERTRVVLIISKIKKKEKWKDRKINETNKKACRCSFLVVITFLLLFNHEKKEQTTLEMIQYFSMSIVSKFRLISFSFLFFLFLFHFFRQDIYNTKNF